MQKDICTKYQAMACIFDTAKLSDYGKLAKLNIGGLKAGVRVAVDGKNISLTLRCGSSVQSMPNVIGIGQSIGAKDFPGWHLDARLSPTNIRR